MLAFDIHAMSEKNSTLNLNKMKYVNLLALALVQLTSTKSCWKISEGKFTEIRWIVCTETFEDVIMK